MIYHVSVKGSDLAAGTADAPLRSINRASQLARPGDTVRVHEGTYREWVNPIHGGTSEHRRIVYEAAEGERVVIKGSEVVTGWERVRETVWKKTLPNEMFGEWNPYAIPVWGDWLAQPTEYQVHLGDVYLNGVSMYEATSEEDLYSGEMRRTGVGVDNEPILFPEQTVYKWRAKVDEDTTTVYANFREYDPNAECVEINVRPCCFYPKETGVNYITLRGFEIAQAACPWTPPTSDQIGMVGPHWSRGWIIENNVMHDAKCSAVSLGKDHSSGHNLSSYHYRKSGHRHQLESVFIALQNGWRKETVGSHVVRRNRIYDCGQNAIVGHLGGVFSHIHDNHIYHIAIKHEFFGYEIAGIKLHAAIDTVIEHNHIHDSTLGVWLDWQAQGSRVTRNVMHHNIRDLMIEVTHGPFTVDHNILTAHTAMTEWNQGGAIVHNLILGNMHTTQIMDRSTPYHFPHSTDVLGYSEILLGDKRIYNNLFSSSREVDAPQQEYFTTFYDDFTTFEEYAALKNKDCTEFLATPQPVSLRDNGYSGLAKPSKHDTRPTVADGLKAEVVKENGEWVLMLDLPAEFAAMSCDPVTTERLGETRISAMAFEAPDGSDLCFDYDVNGEKHGERLFPGPFATLKPGKQRFTLWKE